MRERHSVDFRDVSFNILSDAERGTITLQFEKGIGRANSVPEPIRRILTAISRRYGSGVTSRLNRWRTREDRPFVPPSHSKPHPDNPDVLCFEIGVKQGERIEAALAALLGFLRQQPGYQRTLGAPLDRDQMPLKAETAGADVSGTAQLILQYMCRKVKAHSSEEL